MLPKLLLFLLIGGSTFCVSMPAWASKTPASLSASAAAKNRSETPETTIEDLQIGAFVDIEARIAAQRSFDDRGVSLNDAALTLTKGMKDGRVFIDFPFSSSSNAQMDSFEFATRRAEAYLLLERASFQLKMGQYATFFGYEANASRDRLFANWGPIRGFVLPKTHMGVQLGVGSTAAMAFFQVANPNGAGTLGRESLEFGGGLRLESSPIDLTLGATLHEAESVPSGNRTNALAEIRGGFGKNRFRLDAGVNVKRSAGSERTGDALGLLASYRIDDPWLIGLRLERLRDIYTVLPTGAGTLDSVFSVSGGGLYRYQSDLFFRADLTVADMKAPGLDEVFEVFTLSAVAYF